MSKEAMKLALEAFETLTQYNMVRANIFRRFEPTCTGDYVDLREFREKAEPAITALREALAEQPRGKVTLAQHDPCGWQFFQDGKWHNGMETNNHRANTEAAGVPVRGVYPATQQAPDYAWPTIADYEKEVGFEVNDAFKAAWTMARTTNDLFKQRGENT